MNSLLGMNLMAIWFWRNHNRIATELAKINPCWDDDKLFNTARDINIASYVQIFLYELLPLLMGKCKNFYNSMYILHLGTFVHCLLTVTS